MPKKKRKLYGAAFEGDEVKDDVVPETPMVAPRTRIPQPKVEEEIEDETEVIVMPRRPKKKDDSLLDLKRRIESERSVERAANPPIPQNHRGLELEVAKLKTDLERQKIEYERKNSMNEMKISELESQLKSVTETRRFLAESEAALKSEVEGLISDLSATKTRHSTELDEAHRTHSDEQRQWEDEKRSMSDQIRSFEHNLENCKKQCQLLETEKSIMDSTPHPTQPLSDNTELEQCRAELLASQSEIKRLSGIVSTIPDIKNRVSEVEEENRAQRVELSELQRLRATHDSIAVLKEENRELQQLKAKYTTLLHSKESFVQQLTESRSDRDMLITEQKRECEDRIAQVLADSEALAERVGSLTAELSTVAQKNMESERKTTELEAENQSLRNQVQSSQEAVQRIDKRLVFLTKARDGLKRLIASYDTSPCDDVKLMRERNAVLEKEVKEVEKECGRLEAKLREGRSGVEGGVKGGGVEMEKLLNQIAELEHRVGRGEVNPEVSKVLHMKQNPVADSMIRHRDEKIRRLTVELDTLRSGGSSVGDGTVIAQLNKRIEESEKARSRLLQVFSHKSKEFREVVFLLTGYRIDMVDARHQYKVQSMYATNEGDYFLFKTGRGGQTDMLATEHAEKWRDSIDLYLSRLHSIPGFLAHVTQELFSNQEVTMM